MSEFGLFPILIRLGANQNISYKVQPSTPDLSFNVNYSIINSRFPNSQIEIIN